MTKLGYIAIPIGLALSGLTLAPEPEPDPLPIPAEKKQDLRYVSSHLASIDDIPRDFHFGAQLVPVHEDQVRYRLKKQINKFSKYSYGNSIITRRLGRYEDTFRQILREEGVPEDFVYLAVTESNLSNAISPVGAKGFWQFMPATAREYGLEVSLTIDERYHPEKAARAAAQYLLDSYEEFEDWFLVAAAYNMGPYGVSKALRKQDACSYFDLDLNRETQQYVYKILAYKIILNQPFKYGTKVSEEKMLAPIEFNAVEVSKNIPNLRTFASQHGTDLESLKSLNPWLVANHLNVKSGKTYEIRIPLDENLRMDELAVTKPNRKKKKAAEQTDLKTNTNGESLVQELEKPVLPKAVKDSTNKV